MAAFPVASDGLCESSDDFGEFQMLDVPEAEHWEVSGDAGESEVFAFDEQADIAVPHWFAADVSQTTESSHEVEDSEADADSDDDEDDRGRGALEGRGSQPALGADDDDDDDDGDEDGVTTPKQDGDAEETTPLLAEEDDDEDVEGACIGRVPEAVFVPQLAQEVETLEQTSWPKDAEIPPGFTYREVQDLAALVGRLQGDIRALRRVLATVGFLAMPLVLLTAGSSMYALAGQRASRDLQQCRELQALEVLKRPKAPSVTSSSALLAHLPHRTATWPVLPTARRELVVHAAAGGQDELLALMRMQKSRLQGLRNASLQADFAIVAKKILPKMKQNASSKDDLLAMMRMQKSSLLGRHNLTAQVGAHAVWQQPPVAMDSENLKALLVRKNYLINGLRQRAKAADTELFELRASAASWKVASKKKDGLIRVMNKTSNRLQTLLLQQYSIGEGLRLKLNSRNRMMKRLNITACGSCQKLCAVPRPLPVPSSDPFGDIAIFSQQPQWAPDLSLAGSALLALRLMLAKSANNIPPLLRGRAAQPGLLEAAALLSTHRSSKLGSFMEELRDKSSSSSFLGDVARREALSPVASENSVLSWATDALRLGASSDEPCMWPLDEDLEGSAACSGCNSSANHYECKGDDDGLDCDWNVVDSTPEGEASREAARSRAEVWRDSIGRVFRRAFKAPLADQVTQVAVNQSASPDKSAERTAPPVFPLLARSRMNRVM